MRIGVATIEVFIQLQLLASWRCLTAFTNREYDFTNQHNNTHLNNINQYKIKTLPILVAC